MTKKAKSAVHWFADRTSMHGIPSLVKSQSRGSKVFWTVVCVIGMGMFFFMLTSLILKYISCPVVTKVYEVPKGVILPDITFCSGNFGSLMDEIAYANLVKKKNAPSEKKNKDAVSTINKYHISKNMNRLQSALTLHKQQNASRKEFSQDQHKILLEWSSVTKHLDKRWVVETLLAPRRVEKLQDLNEGRGGNRDNLLVYCSSGGIECDLSHMKYVGGLHNRNCYTFSPVETQMIAESTVQGIENGVILVFMTGSKLLASEFGTEVPDLVTGFRNTFDSSMGSDSVRVIIHPPGQTPQPSLEGIDISAGMATTLGITSREAVLLPHPCGECSDTDHEMQLLKDMVLAQSNIRLLKTPYSQYDPGTCRINCLLRRIWMECGCLLFDEILPIYNNSLLCGQTDGRMFYDSAKHGTDRCFEIQNIFSEICQSFLRKFMNEIVCVERVFKMESNPNIPFTCNCPASCLAIDYQLAFGASRWPRPGPELHAAYESVVSNIVVPHFQHLNISLTEGPIQYLSNTSNKDEIMENFARVTVYIKSMRSERIEQLKGYSFLDLISDIGGQLGLWVGISAITLCEICGFLSLLLQTICNKSQQTNKQDKQDTQT